MTVDVIETVKGVRDTVKVLRSAFPELPIIAGKVTRAAGMEYLADCGENIIKVDGA